MNNATRNEAERLIGIAEKLLQNRDLMGSREFALLAQETEPLLEGSDQILAIVDVLLAADKRVNNHPDWYAILQVDRRSDDLDVIKKQYRRLALLLHPDKSRFAYADHAFKLVADAWALFSDPVKKSVYDKELSFFSRVDLSVPGWVQQEKLSVRRPGPGPEPGPNTRNSASARDQIHADESSRRRNSTFWTACPYCYCLYEYPRIYEGNCLRCQNCDRSFHGVAVPTLPPLVPGQDAYYCCWGFFPMGFVMGNFGSPEKEAAVEVPAPQPPPPPPPPASQPASSLPNWMPVPADNGAQATPVPARVTRSATTVAARAMNGTGPKKKRGRPRKYPLQS
ncbi:J protein JJJ2 [Vigna umbellata]|uniref:J protein JJJ2 n=1 Tax=Vigna umbellata TaxID=87088 RepID=UPI001F5EEC94|nr:J protein JJJ2 [Vigna umbellata]